MDDLEIIRMVMDQHRVLAQQIDSASATMSDKDAVLRLERAQRDLTTNLRRPLMERRAHLIEALDMIAKGLESHYSFEERTLPPLLGELLMNALTMEHKDLTGQMRDVISAVGRIDLKKLDHDGEISRESEMSLLLGKLRDKKLDHQKREEAILLTLQRIYEEKADRSA